MDTNTPSLNEKLAILCRDQSDVRVIRDLFGDELLSMVGIFSGSPDDLATNQSSPAIFTYPLKSCFIVVEAGIMKDELQRKSQATPYQDLLKSAKRHVGKNIVPRLWRYASVMALNPPLFQRTFCYPYFVRLLFGFQRIQLFFSGQ